MKIAKPLTDNIKQKAYIAYHTLRVRYPSYVTKEELMAACDIKNERVMRDVMNYVRKQRCIITTSSTKGYKAALTNKDISEVIHAWQEIDSRIQELEETKVQLIKFYDYYKEKGLC